jgi:2Fe-2S ferredoxin
LPTITYLPAQITLPCQDGDTVFGVARAAGVPITTACGAKSTCGLCRVKIIGGAEHLSPVTDAEKRHLGNVYFITKMRLSCQTQVSGGNVTVEVPGAPGPKKR